MDIIKKLDAILAGKFPLSVMRDAYKLTRGLSFSTEADIDSKELEEMEKYGTLSRHFIKSILPEKYQKYSDLDKIFDVHVYPIDQYQIKKFKQLAAEIEQDINQHSDDMGRMRKELSIYVFSKILSILKKDYGLNYSLDQVENAIKEFNFTSKHFVTGTISIANFASTLKDRLQRFTSGQFKGVGWFDKIEQIFKSNKFLKLHKEYERKQIELNRLRTASYIITESLKNYHYLIDVSTKNPYAAYAEWFRSETGNSDSSRIAPKELQRKDPDGWTYVVISRSPVDMGKAMDTAFAESWKDFIIANMCIERYAASGVLVAFECKIDDISKVNRGKPRLTNIVSKVALYPQVPEKNKNFSDSILVLGTAMDNLINDSKSQEFSMKTELMEYIDSVWNNSRRKNDIKYVNSPSIYV